MIGAGLDFSYGMRGSAYGPKMVRNGEIYMPPGYGTPHQHTRVDPVTELVLADFDQTERRLERVTKQARSGDAEAIAEKEWLERVKDALAEGRPVRSVPAPESAPAAVRHLQALTSKPMLYVVNVDEGEVEVPADIARHASDNGAVAIALSHRIEGELAELDPTEAEEMRVSINTLCISKLLKMLDEGGRRDLTSSRPADLVTGLANTAADD
jgi:ribosome-binding ATPase YchF (GTP1/OBG family)